MAPASRTGPDPFDHPPYGTAVTTYDRYGRPIASRFIPRPITEADHEATGPMTDPGPEKGPPDEPPVVG